MAVYKRRYEPYPGPLAMRWKRCFVLTRYAWQDLFRSRFFWGFFLVCLIPVLVSLGYLFVVNSDLIRTLFSIRSAPILTVGARFFAGFVEIQGAFAFLLTCWACPTLVAGDLSNGALPLFLSRPISRAEYVTGKFAVLALLLSFITWIPALALLFIQGGLSANAWLGPHVWIAGPILWCSFAWITLLSLLALAVSAWVKWRIIAMGAIFGVFLLPAGFGAVIDAILHTYWGHLLSLDDLFHIIVQAGFGSSLGGTELMVPAWAAWGMLAIVYLTSLELLHVRLRAFAVVRG